MRTENLWVTSSASGETVRRPIRRLRRGVTLVWAAICMIALIGFCALAVDWGYTYFVSQQLQNAADAAALAGA